MVSALKKTVPTPFCRRNTVYAAGNELPIFTVGDLTFGIFICYESNYYNSPRYSVGFQLRRRDA
jgi:predicted amidohydrolase